VIAEIMSNCGKMLDVAEAVVVNEEWLPRTKKWFLSIILWVDIAI